MAGTGTMLERIAQRSARVAVLGQGYVGLVVSMRASEAGFEVIGFEIDQARATALTTDRSFVEDVNDEVLAAALDRGYVATSDASQLASFDIAVISVPNPLHERLPDLSNIGHAAKLVAPHLSPGAWCIGVHQLTGLRPNRVMARARTPSRCSTTSTLGASSPASAAALMNSLSLCSTPCQRSSGENFRKTGPAQPPISDREW